MATKFHLFAAAALAPLAASAGLLYEPSNYAARDALLLQLDGIRNVGLLKAHDNATDTWFNLVDPRTSATLLQYKSNTGDSGWRDNAYLLDGDKYWQTLDFLGGSECTTIEVFGDLSLESMENWANYISRVSSTDCGIWIARNASTLTWKVNVDGLGVSTRPTIPNWDGQGFSAVLDKTQCLLYSGGVAGTAQARNTSHSSLEGSKYNIGCSYNTSYVTKGTFYSVRIYNRALTADEIRQNYDLDQIRFVTGMPVTNVVVATAVAGLEGNEETGVYAFDEDGYTFTAPHRTTKDGFDYTCTGYTLERWDDATGTWGAPVSHASCSYPATDTSAKVRLTWQWQYAGGAAPADLDPLFDNYVTDGLVLHLDGIRNAGLNAPHDYSATQWIDLAGGKTATFARDAGDASEWKEDGYYFDARSYAQVAEQLASLGKQVTVQVVCEADTNVLYASKIAQTKRIDWPQLIGCNNNDTLNVYYDLNNSTPNHQLTFKCATTANNAFIAKGSWGKRYVTAIRNGADKYVFQSTAIADATGNAHKTGATDNDIPAATVYVGSAGNSVELRSARWFKGTIKSVRIYSRVLSDAELAQNRAIDEVRFFGAPLPTTNVVVASSVRGLSGDAPEGVYALPAGGHTFTAPASATVGADTFACSGYTLETWDDATGAWGAPVSHGGVLAAALTDTTAKVRLTWQWAHTAGPGFDLAFNDYVADGLVVHLDGIRNTAPEAIHDASATAWRNLAAKNSRATFVIDGGSGWTADGYRFDGRSRASYAVLDGPLTLGNAFTAQAVVDFHASDSLRLNTLWPAIFGTTAAAGDPFAMYFNQNNNATPGVNFKVANAHVRSGGLVPWGGRCITGLSDGSVGALFQTATPGTTAAFSKAVGTQTFTFGSGNGSGQGYGDRRFNGLYNTARIYGRALTDAELETNRAVDEERFLARPPASGSLIVASTVEGLAGDLPCGPYRPAAGFAFTAPAAAALDGVPYVLKGFTLETWDGSAWSAPVSHESRSYSADVSSASARLTWNWAPRSRLTRVDGYDVDDYVQNGLVLHLDGIRNAGAAAEHDPDATTWVNLGANGAALDAVFDYAADASAGDGWEDDGYRFAYGGAFARLASNPTFNWEVTVQVVCEAEPSAKPSGNTFPTYFGSTNDFLNIYGFKPVSQGFFKIFNGNRVEVAPSGTWQGKYLTAIWHAGARQIFQTAVPDLAHWEGAWRSKFTKFSGQPFYVGGVYKDGDSSYVDDRRLTGKIQAIRVYNRSLSDEELEHNRMVDEVRFKGFVPESNVIVAAKFSGYEGEPAGAYVVEGTYTFTAGAVTDPRTGATRRIFGYTVETWNDATQTWGSPVEYEGGSYTYVEGAKVRLTWKWQPTAFVLIVR